MPESPQVAKVLSIREQVEERIRAEQEGLGPEEPHDAGGGPPPLTPEFIEECLENNERGDGVLYATLMRDRFVYVKKRDKRPWLVWREHHWAIDVKGEHITAVEEVALVYLKASEDLKTPLEREKELLNEANARVKAANKRAKELEKLADPDLAAQVECDSVGKEAEKDAALHLANYKALQRKRKRYTERVDRLRSKPGAEKCVWWAHHLKTGSLAIDGDEIDKRPMLLPCPNGVINLVLGCLQKGRPSDYLLRAIPIEYPEHLGKDRIRRYLETGEDFMFPPWQDFIDDLVPRLSDGKPDVEVLTCLQKLLGNSITGDTSLHKIVIVIGDGRNGKGVMFRACQAILGEFAWTIKSKLLLDQKNQSSADGPSPSITALKNRRLAVASETDKHRYISAAQVKEFSGGDTLNARDVHGLEEENFVPTHHLWLQTNNIPGGLFKEFSLRQRLVVFDFPYMYVDDPELEARKEPHNADRFRQRDNGLNDRLMEGLPYILLWLIRGALLVQRDGLQLPDRLRGGMEGLQLLEDHLEQFLRGCCLQEFDPEKTDYESGDLVNVKDPDQPEKMPGRMYVAAADNPQGQPGDSDGWRYQGPGLDPTKVSLFKEFYSAYKKWYEDNITNKEKDFPSSKNVGGDMRKKGYDVRAKGGQTRIFGEIRMIATAG